MTARKVLWQALKVAVSIGLIAFLIHRISPANLLAQLRHVAVAPLAAAAAIFFTSVILGAWQWHRLLAAGGIALPFAKTFRVYYIGLFFNNFLPAGVGGDLVKIYDVTKFGNDPYQVFATTILDRVVGIAGLCLLALAASFVLMPGGGLDNLWIYVLVFAGCVAPVLALILNRRLSRAVRGLFGRITVWGIGNRFDVLFRRLGEYRRVRTLLVGLTWLAVAVQFLRVVTHVLVARALGVDMTLLTFIQFFVFVPLLGLLMVLPISINGLGVREGAGVLLFTQIGFTSEQALLMELITYGIMVIVSLVGGVYFFQRTLARSISTQRGKANENV
jgi:uncharacterized protein (TIRG00374 family)